MIGQGLIHRGGTHLTSLTLSGDITLGANKVVTTSLSLKENATDNYYWESRNVADSAYMGFAAETFKSTGWGMMLSTDGYFVRTSGGGSGYGIFGAADSGVGWVEVARLQESADPYFKIGRDDTGVALNAVTDMLVLQAGGGTGNEAANFGLGIAFNIGNAASQVEQRASIDLVLTDATDASEDVELNFGLMIAGAAPTEILSIVGGGLDLVTGKVMSVAGVQVVGARVVDARADDVVDATYGAEEAGVLDALRDAMIAHGLIAAA